MSQRPSRLREMPGIGVDRLGNAADALSDPEVLRLENLDTDLRPWPGALEETRRAVDLIIDRTQNLHDQNKAIEVLTVDNHSDGPYLYLRMMGEGSPRSGEVMELLRMNGGNSSGVGIGCVSWDGSVHADQFWRHYSFGNVRHRPFSQIWMDLSNPLMARLKEKKRHVRGRCASCRFLEVCAGNFRVRAEAITGDLWAPDPACYLTDQEVGIG